MADIPSIPINEPEHPPSAFGLPDSFKMEYHPKSGRLPTVNRFSAFTRTASLHQFRDKEPWRPFQSETDFKFAELAHQAALNKEQVETLLCIIQDITSTGAKLTFRNYGDVHTAWQNAAEQLTPVSIQILSSAQVYSSVLIHQGSDLYVVRAPCCICSLQEERP